MEVKPGYKNTEIGVIPEDWGVKRLGELFEITSSKRVFQREWKTEGIPFYRARELAVLSEKGNVKNELFISKEMYDAYKIIYGVPKIGDVLITGVGTLGKIYVVSDDREFYFKDGNIIWFKTSGKVRADFLRQLYLTQLVTKQIDDASAGTTVGTYTISSAKKTTIPLPTLPEQTAIATALSDTDAFISSIEKIIVKKRNIKHGAMQQLLTGKKRLPGFSKEWETKKFKEILEYEQPWKYTVRNTEYSENGTPVLTANKSFLLGYTNETDGICNNTPVIIFDDFTTDSKYVNFPFKVKSSAIKLLRTKDNRADLRFVFAKIQLIRFHLGDHKRYYISEYQHLEVLVPELEEQTAIAQALSDIDSEIEALERKLGKYRLIKQGMMQELLTGKKRLI